MKGMVKITLKCFNCGKEKEVIVNSYPAFSFELVDIADNSGMLGVLDFNRNRALVFCGEDCCNSSLTKEGVFRCRPNYRK